MKLEIMEGPGIEELDKISRSIGNTPMFKESSLASVLRTDDGQIIGFISVQIALHASGSWVHPEHRKKGYTYQLRALLESEMRNKGVQVYFSFPQTSFERELFTKYGPVKEQFAQVKEL